MEKGQFFKKYPWALHLLIMVGVSAVILVLVFVFIRIYARQGAESEIPDMVGMSIEEAMANDGIGLEFVVQDSIFREGEAGGTILTQDPKGGTMVKSGRKVYLSITSYNADDAILPELAGLSVRQAVSELYGIGLSVGKLTFVEDPYKNSVVDQSCKGKSLYAGQQIARGSVVDLVVGSGDGTGSNSVPFVIGKTADRARRDILSVSLNVGKEHFRDVKDKRTAVVYRQEPDYTGVNKYPYGTSVELWYIDADNTDVARMISEFKVDSSKIIDPNEVDDGRPSPEDIEDNSDSWSW
ncbi:MAG: PASTA domain-containing protein [Bacteroidales bacterium]|nr:PASTA domain-containing protein [Bacteroidales bacterium]